MTYELESRVAKRRVTFTRGSVDSARCEAGKSQTLYWDTKQPGLGLRVTAAGAKTFIFERKLGRQTVRMTIGPATMQIRAAKDNRGAPTVAGADTRAAELAALVAKGIDPRAQVQRAIAVQAAARVDKRRQTVTAREAWTAYLADRRPLWGERHYTDHLTKGAVGGNIGKRGKAIQPGILAPLLALPLRDLDAPTIEAWAAREAQTRATSARLAWRLLKAFLAWCAEHKDFKGVTPTGNPAKSKRTRENLGQDRAKADVLQRGQLSAWFDAVRAIGNPVVAAYCQTVLLTGARPGEVLAMRWADLNTQWHGLTIRDKVDGERVIPLTPYVQSLLAALPRRGPFVFSGVRGPVVAAPNEKHSTACAVAGLKGLTLHGLRRSFKSLSEWLEVPAGVVAQLMGHKPSATAERHYTVRPLDLLRVHHEKIEAWILEQGGIKFDPAQPAGLRVVHSQ